MLSLSLTNKKEPTHETLLTMYHFDLYFNFWSGASNFYISPICVHLQDFLVLLITVC